MTGYWFTADPQRPQQLPSTLTTALTRFLDAGEPPVFVGFGSMAGPDPAATTTTVLDAARLPASGWFSAPDGWSRRHPV